MGKQEASIYECSICHATFETMAELHAHIAMTHP